MDPYVPEPLLLAEYCRDAEASALISGANSKESSISTESLMAVEAFVQEISALIKQDGKDTDTMLLSFFHLLLSSPSAACCRRAHLNQLR